MQAEQRDRVQAAAADLEASGGPVDLSWLSQGSSPCTMDLFDGTWELLYSSAFGSGNLGGARPGPPNALTPVRLVRNTGLVNATRKAVRRPFGERPAPCILLSYCDAWPDAHWRPKCARDTAAGRGSTG